MRAGVGLPVGKTATGRVLAIGALLAAPLPAAAQPVEGFEVDHGLPAPRGSDWLVLDSLRIGDGDPRPEAAVGATLGVLVDPLTSEPGGGRGLAVLSAHVPLYVGGSVVFEDRVRFGAMVPTLLAQDGRATVLGEDALSPGGAPAFGDPRFSVDARVLGRPDDPLCIGVGATLRWPIGSESSLVGEDALRFGPRAGAAGRYGVFQYALTAFFEGRKGTEAIGGVGRASRVGGAVAAGVRLLSERVLVGPELWGSSPITGSGAGAEASSPIEAILGGHYLGDAIHVGMGAGAGVTNAAGSPAFRWLLSLEWRGRMAGAGTLPEAQPRPRSTQPAPDTDGDRIADARDACPEMSGLASADPEQNGCPPPGYYDPALAPSDGDADGIDDGADACPERAGAPSDDPARNGCPAPPDDDGDGIEDAVDACVESPGPRREDPETTGCPDARVEGDRIVLLERIAFATGGAEILAQSQPMLGAVAEVLERRTDIVRVQVQGHTDNRGPDELNRQLSASRARAVVRALVARGVAAERLSAVGHGAARPIASNETEAGRAANRRVELSIIERRSGSMSDLPADRASMQDDVGPPPTSGVDDPGLDAPPPAKGQGSLVPVGDPGFEGSEDRGDQPMLPLDDPGFDGDAGKK